MLKARKLLTATAVSLALASTASHALTLGDIEMRSALNQPMNAQIRLQTQSASEAEGLIVKLASQEAFSRAGLERNPTLNDLKFSVDASNSLAPVIRISSTKPVVEPFLNFLLEVDWPQGRMVREYTVLLDPPVFMSPSDSQRATISEGDVQRATDTSGVPVPIDRSSGLDSFSFDESSVAVVGGLEEVGDSVTGDGFDAPAEIITINESGAEAVSLEGEVVSLEGEVVSLDSGVTVDTSAVESGEFVVVDATGGTGEYIEGASTPLDASEGEIVSLTDSSVASTSGFDVESIDGFNVEVLGGTAEVGDNQGDIAVSTGGSSTAVSVASGEVVVQNGDTLFEIAQRNRVDGVSTQQMMIALLEANQQAFINGNVNLVKAGSVLRIPGSSEAGSITQAQALADVSRQEQLWREYRRGVQGSAPARVASTPASTPASTTNDADASAESAAEETAATDTQTATQESDAAGSTTEQQGGAEELTAKEILEQARKELEQARGELRLVGDNEATDAATSTSADETDQPETNNLGDINRDMQLAREELEASKLKTEELQSRDEALQGTADRMDALVDLRQNEVAKLEQQLADARTGAQNGADAVANVADADATGSDAASTDAATTEDSDATGTEATTEATAQDAARVVQPIESDAAQIPWWKRLLGDQKMLLAGGVGLLALLGLLFTFFRRRKSHARADGLEGEEVDFLEDYEESALVDTSAEDYLGDDVDGDATQNSGPGYGAAAAAVGGTSAAVAAGAAMTGSDNDLDSTIESAALDDSALDEFNATADNATSQPAAAADPLDELGETGADDTLSEADVYIAYGLHGQAEDLLQKAIAEKPDEPEYHYKLLQTYHAQNNASAFDAGAETYHNQFGGPDSPNWADVTRMGGELSPSNGLYQGAGNAVQSLGKGDLNAPKLDDNDFLTGDASAAGGESMGRDFADTFESGNSNIMDQTVDPGAAFAEADLEATGDFTQIADEIRDGASDTLSFPDSDLPGTPDTGSASIADGLGDMLGGAKDNASSAAGGLGDMASGASDKAGLALGGAATGIAGAAGAAAAAVGLGKSDNAQAGDGSDSGIIEFDSSIEATDLDVNAQLPGASSGASTPVADDLTLDLEQLSGDLEMNAADLGDSTGLEMPDLNTADLTGDNSVALGSADEMDTMMDLAKAYIDMGDNDSASSALGEIVKSGSPEQRTEAETLLRKIS